MNHFIIASETIEILKQMLLEVLFIFNALTQQPHNCDVMIDSARAQVRQLKVVTAIATSLIGLFVVVFKIKATRIYQLTSVPSASVNEQKHVSSVVWMSSVRLALGRTSNGSVVVDAQLEQQHGGTFFNSTSLK